MKAFVNVKIDIEYLSEIPQKPKLTLDYPCLSLQVKQGVSREFSGGAKAVPKVIEKPKEPEKKPVDEKKPDEKKVEEKKPEVKKPEVKKPEVKKAEAKKPEVRTGKKGKVKAQRSGKGPKLAQMPKYSTKTDMEAAQKKKASWW